MCGKWGRVKGGKRGGGFSGTRVKARKKGRYMDGEKKKGYGWKMGVAMGGKRGGLWVGKG